MRKNNNAKYKKSRRLGVPLWGEDKDPFLKKNYPPGQHGNKLQNKSSSDYGKQLMAKQQMKFYHGRISEKQFRGIFEKASQMRGDTGENLVGLLERRLDVIIYRLNIAKTIHSARQIVGHKHIMVNGKPASYPSMVLKIGDVIEVREKSKEIPVIIESTQKLERSIPDYLEFDQKSISGKFIRVPNLSEIPYPVTMEPHLVIEFYSR